MVYRKGKVEGLVNLRELESTYLGKKVFVTGHTGFKGAWLLCMLHYLGARVKGYALDPLFDENLYESLNGDSLCESVIGDLRNKKLLEAELLDYQPDFVFHLAAQPLVRLSYQIPEETFEVNAIGTANLLSALSKLSKACVAVLITTDKVYENKEWIYPYRETDRLGGYDPYSASKACAELIISSYLRSFFSSSNRRVTIGVARSGNVIGGGDWSEDRIIPDIIRSFEKNGLLTLRNPLAVRPWQHVLEPLAGYLILGIRLASDSTLHGEAFNFGPYPQDNLTVEQLVKIAIKKMGSGSYKISQSEEDVHEAGLLRLDISKALSKLSWRPRLDSYEAISLTFDWYKKDKTERRIYTESQIINYLNLLNP